MIHANHELCTTAVFTQIQRAVGGNGDVVRIVQYAAVGGFDHQGDGFTSGVVGPDLAVAIVATAGTDKIDHPIVVPGTFPTGKQGRTLGLTFEAQGIFFRVHILQSDPSYC